MARAARGRVPVHVGQTGQDVSRFSKAAILLIVSPQEVHVAHFALVLLDHVHQMLFEILRVDLHETKTKNKTNKACNIEIRID